MVNSAYIERGEHTAAYPNRSLIKGDAAFAHQRKFWQHYRRPLLTALTSTLQPLTQQGYPELSQLQLLTGHEVQPPEQFPVEQLKQWRFFMLSEQTRLLGLLRIDPCTLMQLAGAYYGSKDFQWLSPTSPQLKPEQRQAERLYRALLTQLSPESAQLNGLNITCINELSPEHYRDGVEFVANWPDETMLPAVSFWLAPELADRFCSDDSPALPEQVDLSEELKHKLQQVPVQLKVELASMQIPLHNLNQLQPGEILPINLHPSCPVTIAGRRLFNGQVHTQDNSMVVKISHE